MNTNMGLLINGDDFSIKDAAIIGAAAALVAGIGVAIHKLHHKDIDEDDFEDDDLFDEEPAQESSEPVKEEAPAQDPATIDNENPEPAKFTVVDENGNPLQ